MQNWHNNCLSVHASEPRQRLRLAVQASKLCVVQVVAGAVYAPLTDQMFSACRGGGAFCNSEPLQHSGEQQLTQALVATEIGTFRDTESVDAIFERTKRVSQAARSLRCAGSCALNMCNVAAGRLDGFYEIGFGGCWDVAAASIIVQEAGGRVLDPAGGAFDLMACRVLAGTPNVAEQLAEVLKACPVSAAEPQPPQ